METMQEKKQEKFELTITAEHVTSTDTRFTMDDIHLGNNYRPLDAVFRKADGAEIKRIRRYGENRISNQTLPRLACQIFEKKIAGLSAEEKENFPICRYKPDSEMIRGIYPSEDVFKQHRNTIESLTYTYDGDRQFVFYCWNIFSTILFVQECLKRFGESGDQFVLTYREKVKKEAEAEETETENREELGRQNREYKNPFSPLLIECKNLIFHGAPGTGKSHLAREIAADIISEGYFDDLALLSDAQKTQVEFVQFHPSYDYADFVEGLRPQLNDDGSMGFALRDGIFKQFVARARKNDEDSRKSPETMEKELSAQAAMEDFFASIEFGVSKFKTINGSVFMITGLDDRRIFISIPENATVNKLTLNMQDIRKMLESGRTFAKVRDVVAFFGKTYSIQAYSYDFAIYKKIKARIKTDLPKKARQEKRKKYIFIIDEINRGEISKIFGELFFAIDPGYRGKAGEITTQYAYLHADPNEKFYVPDNVYIIGTMNDIDRSVESFDYAMRRRFQFAELKANACIDMLDALKDEALKEEAIRRMKALNREISKIEDLNDHYHIGAAYFLKLKSFGFDRLWTDYLQPLLREYIHGMCNEEEIMQRFAKAYGYRNAASGDENETAQDQG